MVVREIYQTQNKIDETVRYSRGINSILARFFFNIDLYCPLIFPYCVIHCHTSPPCHTLIRFFCALTQTREEINQYNKRESLTLSLMTHLIKNQVKCGRVKYLRCQHSQQQEIWLFLPRFLVSSELYPTKCRC